MIDNKRGPYEELMTRVFASLTLQEQEAVLKYFTILAGYTIAAGETLKILKEHKIIKV